MKLITSNQDCKDPILSVNQCREMSFFPRGVGLLHDKPPFVEKL